MITKIDLAKATGVSRQTLTDLEAGNIASPEDATVAALSAALAFPREFFFRGDIHEIPPDQPSFRSLRRMTARQRDAVLAAGSIAFELAAYLEQNLNLPAPNIPDLREMKAEAAAALVRREWGMGGAPVRSMVHLLEAQGVKVFSLAERCAEVDAYSLWHASQPFVFLNTAKSGERSRFDAAHELAHLVLHRHRNVQESDAEGDADAFASAFLMPKEEFLGSAPDVLSIDKVLKLKKVWGVSAAAAGTRLHHLGRTKEWAYRQFFIDLSARGWRTNEPEAMPREASQLLRKAFDVLRTDGITVTSIAEHLAVSVRDIEELVFALVLRPVPGGSPFTSGTSRMKGKLSLV